MPESYKLVTEYTKAILTLTVRNHEINSELTKSALTRLVWFVAISGFGLTISWQSIDRFHPFPLYIAIFITTLWLLPCISSIFAHWFIDILRNSADMVTKSKTSMLQVLLTKGQYTDQDRATLQSLIDDTHPAYKEYSIKADKQEKTANLFERLSLICLLAAFILTPILVFYVAISE